MTTYGITQQGFIKPDATTIRETRENDLKSAYGQDFDVSINSPIGAIIGTFSNAIAELWEALESCYYAQFPDSANDINLDNTCSNVAVSRQQNTYSLCNITLVNNTESPATIPVGSLVRQSSNLKEWETLSEVTIPANGSINVNVRCTETGAISANIGSINTIVNPVPGWDSVSNLIAATIGKNKETDSELRRKRALEIVSSKGGIVEAIVNRIKNEVTGVTFATYRDNRTDFIVDGLPPNTYEIYVEGGNNNDIAQVIKSAAGAGIEMTGTVNVNVTDEFNNVFPIKFSRIAEVPVYLKIILTKNSYYPSDGDQRIINALVDYGSTIDRGQSLINWKLDGNFKDLEGIEGVTIYQSTSPNPTNSNNINVLANQRIIILPENIQIII